MEALAIIGVINTTIKIANALLQAGQDAAPAIAALKKVFAGEEITQADLDALAASNEAMAAELDAPLPPAQPGDPDYIAP